MVSTTAAGLLVPGCFANSVTDEFSTDFMLPDPGPSPAAYEIRKRYRFSRNPEVAQSVRLVEVFIQTIEPADADLSCLQRMRVYAEPEEGLQVPVASVEALPPGEHFADAVVEYDGDLRPLIAADGRLVLTWMVEPNVWYRPYPEAGIRFFAKGSVEIVL